MSKLMMAMAILALQASAALAAQPTDPCKGATTGDMEDCAVRLGAEAKLRLEKYLKESRRLIGDDKADLQALNRAQDLWAKFVEADCDAAYEHFAGGSIRGLEYANCELGHTEERTIWIWNRYIVGTTSKLPKPAFRDPR